MTSYYKLKSQPIVKLSINIVQRLTSALDIEYFAKHSQKPPAFFFFYFMTLTFQNIRNSDSYCSYSDSDHLSSLKALLSLIFADWRGYYCYKVSIASNKLQSNLKKTNVKRKIFNSYNYVECYLAINQTDMTVSFTQSLLSFFFPGPKICGCTSNFSKNMNIWEYWTFFSHLC